MALIVINAMVFFYELTLSQSGLENFIFQFGAIPARIVEGEGLGTLLTSMFIHAGWLHLIGNMLFLWVFGDNIEAVMGEIPYLIFYLAGGLIASATHILFNIGSDIPSVGASGAIAAVLGAYLVMFPRSRVKLLVLMGRAGMARVTALIFLGLWIVQQIFSGIAGLGVPTAQTEGVAWWAHIGGFAFAVVVGFVYRNRARTSFETTRV
jgi:membrane associated rhomboid family serine protease